MHDARRRLRRLEQNALCLLSKRRLGSVSSALMGKPYHYQSIALGLFGWGVEVGRFPPRHGGPSPGVWWIGRPASGYGDGGWGFASLGLDWFLAGRFRGRFGARRRGRYGSAGGFSLRVSNSSSIAADPCHSLFLAILSSRRASRSDLSVSRPISITMLS